MAKLNTDAVARIRKVIEAEEAMGDPKLAGALDTLLEWHERQGAPFQSRVLPWLVVCFGAEIAGDRTERNHRFLEEALELVQSTGCTRSEAHQLVDYVFDRPVGAPAQEVGGVMVTLAALCCAHDIDMHEAGETELARIWTKVEAIRAKQAAKPKNSPLPMHTEPVDPGPTEAMRLAFDAARGSWFDKMRAALAVASVGGIPAERHVRHLKRGTVYAVLGAATAQVSVGTVPASSGLPAGRILRDDATVVAYVGTDRRLWVRFPDEMDDGRFEEVSHD